MIQTAVLAVGRNGKGNGSNVEQVEDELLLEAVVAGTEQAAQGIQERFGPMIQR